MNIIHCGTIPIETCRLKLRPFVLEDCDSLYKNLTSNQKISDALCLDFHKHISETYKQLENWQNEYLNVNFYKWAIQLKNNDACIGLIELHELQEDKGCCEIGFWIASDYRLQGFASEAAIAVLNFTFETLRFSEVCALCEKENLAVVKVFEKLGMHHTGTLQRHILTPKCEIKDCELYSITNKQKLSRSNIAI